MPAKTTALSVALAVTAIGTLANPASAAPKVGTAVFSEGDVTGIVTAVQRGERRRVKVSVSLHGLTPQTDYRVVAGRGRCSASEPGRAVFLLDFGVQAAQDVFVTELIRREGPLARIKCVHVYEADTDTPIASAVFIGGGAMTGA